MTPARPYGPSRPHREPLRLDAISYADACEPADTHAAALALLRAGFADEAHAVLTSGADAGFPHCRSAAELLERNPPSTAAAIRILEAATEEDA